MATTVVSLTDMKGHLRYPSPSQPSSDDPAIQAMLDAAVTVIEFHCDDVIPKRLSERYNGGECAIFLRHRPVMSVMRVSESWGFVQYELSYQDAALTAPTVGGSSGDSSAAATSIFAYSLDDTETGMITRRSAGNALVPFAAGVRNISVDYVAGRNPAPPNVVLAVRMLVHHWWQNEELRGSAIAGNVTYDAVAEDFARHSGELGPYYGVPNSILELLQSERRLPIIA